MALSPSLATTAATPTPYLSTPLLQFFLNPNRSKSRIVLISRTTSVSCSGQAEQIVTSLTLKTRRKLRPSFNELIKEKWSVKTESPRKKFPWQEEEAVVVSSVAEVEEGTPEGVETERVEVLKQAVVSDFVSNRRVLAPWFQERGPEKSPCRSDEVGDEARAKENDDVSFVEELGNAEVTERNFGSGEEFGYGAEDTAGDFDGKKEIEVFDCALKPVSNVEDKKPTVKSVVGVYDYDVNKASSEEVKEPAANSVLRTFDYNTKSISNGESEELAAKTVLGAPDYAVKKVSNGEVKELAGSAVEVPLVDLGDKGKVERMESSGSLTSFDLTVDLPWVSNRDSEGMVNGKWVRSNTSLAEKLIPDHELKRLRNISLRMLERISVGPAGITQDVVDAVHEKWRTDEVVKLKFEGVAAVNMKRIHEGLERRTGGLVIWRSGGSVVLYRGMTYKLPCAQAYNGQRGKNPELSKLSNIAQLGVCHNVAWNNSEATTNSHLSTKSKYIQNLSNEELMDMSELNLLLDGLGPRFYDWSGPEPLPVDADSLPSFVPGYRPPFRLLPHGAKRCLGNKQMTSVRRLARSMPPHFALGRNRDLQGLAQAMVKLWQTNAIAKIAIKRGVLNTLNEKMAEELKRLTGGTLVSRNKEYIVFHRGNDFLPHAVTATLLERKKLTELHQDEEELVRQKATINFGVKTSKVPLVAGTLAETLAATSRWGSQPTKSEMAKMMKDAAFEKHASLVRYLENKLILAKAKVAKAEKALRKVQEYLEPAELPTDLEIITDEERFLFRKMGLSMKPFLLVGRRKVFDGTIQNMHLHWKYRELVKLIVKENNFALVKHIAISLEAESGGVLVSVDKTTKGYAIIIYRGKNYQRPSQMKPKNLLTRRQALARSIELQRREALKHHILDLEEKIVLLRSGLEDMKSTNEIGDNIENNDLYTRMTSGYFSDKDTGEDEGEEAYLQVYDGGDEDTDAKNENSDETTHTASHCSNDVTDSGTVRSNLWV